MGWCHFSIRGWDDRLILLTRGHSTGSHIFFLQSTLAPCPLQPLILAFAGVPMANGLAVVASLGLRCYHGLRLASAATFVCLA